MTTPAIAMFQSGWGDGFYASYWGLDARGEPVCLVTDFSVLTVQPITATLRFGRPAPLTPGRLDHPALARRRPRDRRHRDLPAAQRRSTSRGATDRRAGQVHLLRRDGDPPRPRSTCKSPSDTPPATCARKPPRRTSRSSSTS
jgi:hypothetical protein